MTTQEELDTATRKIEALENELGMVKAVLAKVASDNVDHVWAHFREEGTTEDISAGVRAPTFKEAWDEFMEGVKYAGETYHIHMTGAVRMEREPDGVLTTAPPEPQYVEVGDTNATDKTAVSQSTAQTSGRVSSDGMPLEEQDQVVGQIYRYTCVAFSVTPQDGGKAKVELFGNLYNNPGGIDKYAYVTVWGTPAQLVSTFASVGNWPESTFLTAKKFQLTQPFYVNWKLGDRKNTAGHYYRNLSSLMPIAQLQSAP